MVPPGGVGESAPPDADQAQQEEPASVHRDEGKTGPGHAGTTRGPLSPIDVYPCGRSGAMFSLRTLLSLYSTMRESAASA